MRPSLCGAIALLFAAGCGGPALAPVSGVVKLNGKPLANATVTFSPVAGKADAIGSSGKTNANGEYTLSAGPGQTGACVGKHRVRITATDHQSSGDSDARPSANAPPAKEKVPEMYNTHTTLEATVNSSDNKINFDLTGTSTGGASKPGAGGDARH